MQSAIRKAIQQVLEIAVRLWIAKSGLWSLMEKYCIDGIRRLMDLNHPGHDTISLRLHFLTSASTGRRDN